MKRLACVLIAVSALGMPAVAQPAEEDYSEPHAKRGGFDITFDVVSRNGQPRRVGNFEYRGVLVTCTERDITVQGAGYGTQRSGPNAAARVRDKTFSKRYAGESPGNGETSQKFTGEFKRRNSRVAGTIQVTGDFPRRNATNCDSGPLEYVAH